MCSTQSTWYAGVRVMTVVMLISNGMYCSDSSSPSATIPSLATSGRPTQEAADAWELWRRIRELGDWFVVTEQAGGQWLLAEVVPGEHSGRGFGTPVRIDDQGQLHLVSMDQSKPTEWWYGTYRITAVLNPHTSLMSRVGSTVRYCWLFPQEFRSYDGNRMPPAARERLVRTKRKFNSVFAAGGMVLLRLADDGDVVDAVQMPGDWRTAWLAIAATSAPAPAAVRPGNPGPGMLIQRLRAVAAATGSAQALAAALVLAEDPRPLALATALRIADLRTPAAERPAFWASVLRAASAVPGGFADRQMRDVLAALTVEAGSAELIAPVDHREQAIWAEGCLRLLTDFQPHVLPATHPETAAFLAVLISLFRGP